MNSKFKKQLLVYFIQQRFSNTKNKGFTLIELLVVVIIIGVLSAVALPNLLQQIGKSREVEIKNTVGTVNRAQQAYHWERQEFAQGASDQESLEELLGLTFDNEYIDTYNLVANINNATVAPTNNESSDDATRAYSGGIFFSSGNYSAIVCQSPTIADSLLPPTASNTCAGDGNQIK